MFKFASTSEDNRMNIAILAPDQFNYPEMRKRA